MNSDLAPAGKFECSNPLLNKIQENAEWTFLSNVFSIESDCPGREKFGYGGDIVTASEAYIYNFDMSNFYAKSVVDFSNDQRPSGGMPECAPDNAIYDKGLTKDTGPIGWMLGFPWMQQKLYQYYGDKQILEQQYDATKKLIEFIRQNAPGHLVEQGLSDHATLAPKPYMVTGTAFYYDHVKKLAGFAAVLGKTEEAAEYEKLADEIKAAFIEKLVDKNTGRVDSATQASQACALYYDLLPADTRSKSLSVLENDIVNVKDNHISAGIFGTKLLFDVLNANGKNDLAYAINRQTTQPSYGYMIENGATTIWEHWQGGGSYNHPMFGSVSEWFYKGLGGINPAPDANGFDKIVINPYLAPELEWMNAYYHSVRGPVESSWQRNGTKITMVVNIPGNSSGTIFFPVSAKVTEKGIPVDRMKELKSTGEENGNKKYSIVPGRYVFEME
jgi:alpha-L-rhamnosidase